MKKHPNTSGAEQRWEQARHIWGHKACGGKNAGGKVAGNEAGSRMAPKE